MAILSRIDSKVNQPTGIAGGGAKTSGAAPSAPKTNTPTTSSVPKASSFTPTTSSSKTTASRSVGGSPAPTPTGIAGADAAVPKYAPAPISNIQGAQGAALAQAKDKTMATASPTVQAFIDSHGGMPKGYTPASIPKSNIVSDRPMPTVGSLDFMARNGAYLDSAGNVITSPAVQMGLQGSQVAPIYASTRAASKDAPAHSGTVVSPGFIQNLPDIKKGDPNMGLPDMGTVGKLPGWDPNIKTAGPDPVVNPTRSADVGTSGPQLTIDKLPIVESGGGQAHGVTGSLYEKRSTEAMYPGGVSGQGDQMTHEKLINVDNANVTNKFKTNLPQVIEEK